MAGAEVIHGYSAPMLYFVVCVYMIVHMHYNFTLIDLPRSASPASRMMESGGSVDWSFATNELLQKTGKDIIEEKYVDIVYVCNMYVLYSGKFSRGPIFAVFTVDS